MRKPIITENQLVTLLKARDKKGFDLLYAGYAKALYDVILRIVRQNTVAEDILQDSFVKIWQNISSYDSSKGTLFTWILNIARNTAIDRLRSHAYKKDACTCGLDNNSIAIDKKHHINQQTDSIHLTKWVKVLKPEHQQLIEYVYIQGYTQNEAAEALHIPLGTAKSRIKNAIHQLRLLLI